MKQMFELMLAGLMGAVVSTLPIGPLNIALIVLIVRKQFVYWWACVLGVIAADVSIGVSSYFLMNSLWDQLFTSEARICWSAGAHGFSALLLAAGFVVLWKYRTVGRTPQSHGKVLGWFASSFFMTALEPGLFPFWSGWWMAMGEHLPLDGNSGLILVCSIAMGDVLVFGSYRFLVHRFPLAALDRLVSISLWLMGAAAAVLFFRFLQLVLTQFDRITSCLS